MHINSAWKFAARSSAAASFLSIAGLASILRLLLSLAPLLGPGAVTFAGACPLLPFGVSSLLPHGVSSSHLRRIVFLLSQRPCYEAVLRRRCFVEGHRNRGVACCVVGWRCVCPVRWRQLRFRGAQRGLPAQQCAFRFLIFSVPREVLRVSAFAVCRVQRRPQKF